MSGIERVGSSPAQTGAAVQPDPGRSTLAESSPPPAADAPRRAARAARTLRGIRRDETATLLGSDAATAALALYGTPILLLEPDRVRRQYRRLCAALPQVEFHYAVRALAHRDVIAALAGEGCGFGIASGEELALLEDAGVDARRMIHTHPVKKPAEIDAALTAGVRTFVVDSESELMKFAAAPPSTSILIRLSSHGRRGSNEVSAKFGVGPFEAAHIVECARGLGIHIAGFSVHVAAPHDPARFAEAMTETLDLMAALERTHGVRFDTLDIGGGFPVAHDTTVASPEEIAAVIRPMLEERASGVRVIAEPGRILVAECMTLVTSVVGVTERTDGRWCHLDDGVCGSYASVAAEGVHPLVFSVRELGGQDSGPHRWATLAGPACDSSDVIAREVFLPELAAGDLLASPVMGACTAVTATRAHARPLTPIVVLAGAPSTGTVPAQRPESTASAATMDRIPAPSPAPAPAPEPARERQTVP